MGAGRLLGLGQEESAMLSHNPEKLCVLMICTDALVYFCFPSSLLPRISNPA